MTYIDASSLPEEPGDWLRSGCRYRLGQYGIRDDGGTYSTYAVIGGRGYRTGTGMDSFAKSVRHIKGLVEPEDVTEHHYSDEHGIGSAERMAGAEPTESFAKVRERSRDRESRAYQGAANNPAFQAALGSMYGDADRARSNRQARIQAMVDDGDCEAAANAMLFVNHGGPLPDFMYDTEYGRKVLDIITNKTSKHADTPSKPYPVQLTKMAWPMRAILGMMFSAIHAEATGEMRKLSSFDGAPNITTDLMNVYGLMDAMDEGERIKRDAGDPYKITLYDLDGNEYIHRFNDYEASKYLMSEYPQGRFFPGNKRIFSGFNLHGPSVYMDRKEREQRRNLSRWLNTYEPTYAMPSTKLDIRLAESGLPYDAYRRTHNRSNDPLTNGWTLDTTRPFEYGYVDGYSRNRDESNGNVKRYAMLKARRTKLEKNAEKFSTNPETARNHKRELKGELDRTLDDLDGKLGEKEGFEKELKKLYMQLDETKERLKEKDLSPAEHKKLNQDIQVINDRLKDVYNNLSVLNKEVNGLDRDSRNLSEKLTRYDELARAQVDGMKAIDKELREMEANDADVKKYLASGEPLDMVQRIDAASLKEMYFETLLDLEKEDPLPLDESKPTERLVQRDEDGRLSFDSLTPDVWTRLNNAYGPEILADQTHILNTMFKTESDTTRRLREAGELRDEEHRLRNRTCGEVAKEYLKARGIDDEDTHKLLSDALFARQMLGSFVTPKGSTRSAMDPHAQTEKELRSLESRLAEKGVSMKDVDKLSNEARTRVHSDLLQVTGTHDGSTYLLQEKQRAEAVDDINEHFGMNSQQKERLDRGEATPGEIAMENLSFAMHAIFNELGGNTDPDARADDRYHPAIEREQPFRDDDGTVSTMHLSSESPGERENGRATAGHEAEGRILDVLDAVDKRRNPKLEEPKMTEMEKLYATGPGNKRDKKNAVSRRLAEELGVGQAIPGLVEPSDDDANEGVDELNEEADEMNDEMNNEADETEERKPKDESDGFTKKAKSANDSRRSMSFREVMGEAASRNEREQGLPTWTDMAGADMRGCDVWKDLWRTVYMESGDGTPTKVRMKVIRDERRPARASCGGSGPRARRRIRAF